jgi:hypothetical protein
VGTIGTTDEGAYYDVWFVKVDASGAYIPETQSWLILPLLLNATFMIIICIQKLPKNR